MHHQSVRAMCSREGNTSLLLPGKEDGCFENKHAYRHAPRVSWQCYTDSPGSFPLDEKMDGKTNKAFESIFFLGWFSILLHTYSFPMHYGSVVAVPWINWKHVITQSSSLSKLPGWHCCILAAGKSFCQPDGTSVITSICPKALLAKVPEPHLQYFWMKLIISASQRN